MDDCICGAYGEVFQSPCPIVGRRKSLELLTLIEAARNGAYVCSFEMDTSLLFKIIIIHQTHKIWMQNISLDLSVTPPGRYE